MGAKTGKVDVFVIQCSVSMRCGVYSASNGNSRIRQFKFRLDKGQLWGGKMWRLQRDWAENKDRVVFTVKESAYPGTVAEIIASEWDSWRVSGYRPYSEDMQFVDRLLGLLQTQDARERILTIVDSYE